MYELSFLNRFEETPESERPGYVAAELRRIVTEGEPLLTTVLRCPDDDAKSLALTLLRDGVTETGETVFDEPPAAVRLRLEPDAIPPERDPQNRKLPEKKRGHVLVAKVGNKGGRLPEKADAKVVASFSGQRRQVLVSGGADLYETAEITREWKSFSLRNATLILKTWGLGVQKERCVSHLDRATGELIEGQSFYLVEEQPQPKELAPPPPVDDKKPKKPAARGAGA